MGTHLFTAKKNIRSEFTFNYHVSLQLELLLMSMAFVKLLDVCEFVN